MSTDAAGLYEQVRGVMGEAWWPHPLEWSEHFGGAWVFGGTPLHPVYAAALIRDAATEELLRLGDLGLRPIFGGGLLVKLHPFDADDWRGGVYPDRLTGLLAALAAVKGGGK